jgi:hypothetical protein
VFEESPDAAGDESFDAADGLPFGHAFASAARDVGLGGGTAALPSDGHEVEGAVELAVTASVEAVTVLALSGGGLDRSAAGEAGVGRFVAAAAGVGPGEVEGGGSDVADATFGDQLRGGLVEQLFERPVVVGDLAVEVLDAAGQGAHGGAGAALIDVAGHDLAEAGAAGNEVLGAQPTQLAAQLFVGSDNQRLELVDRRGAGTHRGGPGHAVDTDRFTHPGMGARLRQTLATQCLTAGADGVEGVGLGAVLGRLALGPVELEDPFPAPLQHHRETAAVAGGALDHPRPFRGHTARVGPQHGVPVAVARGSESLGRQHSRGSRLEQGDSDPVSIGVDAHDVVDQFCKHGGWNLPVSVSVGAGLDATATPGL